MAKITKDDFELDNLSEKKEKGPTNAPEGERKFSEAGTVGGAIADTLTLGHADSITNFLKRLGLATDQAATQTTKEAMAENPKSAALGTGLALALPVAGVESLIGKGARAAGSALGGEGALAGGGRAALAELGVGEAAEAGKAATGGGEADWAAPLYSAAFAGPLAAFGGRLAAKARGPEAAVRKAVPGVPEGTALPSTRTDPSKTIPDVALTAPEALKEAGLGQQASDAEALLRRTLGGEAPVVPGRNAALDTGSDIRSAATSRMPPGAPAYQAMDKQNLFEMFRSGLDEGVTPTPPPPPTGNAAAGFAGRLGFNATIGKIPILGDIASAMGGDEAAGRLAQSALGKIMGSSGMPKNAAAIEQILMDPAKFAGILQPEEIAALTKYAAARATIAGTAGQMGPGVGGDDQMERIRKRFPAL